MSKPSVQQTALKITRAVGSPMSIILHTLAFLGSFVAVLLGFVTFDRMLLILTTIVSLEAIYLAIFIQMTINYQAEALASVEQDIDEIQENVGEIQEDVEEISEDVGEISEDVEEIQKDVDELQEDVEEMSEDVEEMSEEEQADEKRKKEQRDMLSTIQTDLQRLLQDIEKLKGKGA